ncbi:hypothetical protein H0X06_00335 [Candidatus Dependentiae bacterium]|nr:hypothetical protein [Candidatus Dependentiae bacterium]
MFKKALIVCMVVAPVTVQAVDWLDDVAALYTGTSFNESKAVSIVEGYRKKDELEVKELEKKAAAAKKPGVVGKITEASYQPEISVLNAQVSFYKKVERAMKDFSENKKDKEKFMASLKKLNRYKKQLEDVRAKYRADSGNVSKAKHGTVIAAKEAQVLSYKTYMKGLFLAA